MLLSKSIRWDGLFTTPNMIDYNSLKELSISYNIEEGELLDEILKNKKKRVISVYGNFQTNVMTKMLSSSRTLCREYLILSFGGVQTIRGDEEIRGFSDNLIKNIDVLIYQNVSGNGNIKQGLSTKRILNQLRSDAKTVAIPNIYFAGYFPQVVGAKAHTNIVFPLCLPGGIRKEQVIFPHGDKNIDSLMKSKGIEEIEKILSDPLFYSASAVEANFNRSIHELQSREAFCNVKISQYILNNYQDECLFYTVNHPRKIIIYRVLLEALKYLGIPLYDMQIDDITELDGNEIFIYPSVMNALKLNFDKRRFYWCKFICNERVGFHDYISAYVHICRRSVIENSSEKEILYYFGKAHLGKPKCDEQRNCEQGFRLPIYKRRYELLLEIHRTKFDMAKIPSKFAIYGAGNVGKVFYDCLPQKQNVVCFFDKYSIENDYNGIPILSLAELDTSFVCEGGTIVVTPVYDYEAVCDEVRHICPKATIVSLNAFLDECGRVS